MDNPFIIPTNPTHSNTTLVKVKLKWTISTGIIDSYSNTTLVKVKWLVFI